MRSQVIAAGVGGPAQGTLESSREMHMIMVSYVRHHFAAQLATMQITAARQSLECQTHVPGFGAFSTFNGVRMATIGHVRFMVA